MSKVTKKLASVIMAFMLAFTMVLSCNVQNAQAATNSVLKNWSGTFEKSLANTTGWGTFDLNFYKANKNGKKLSTKWGTIGKTKAFLIKGVSGEYLKVVYGGKTGYVNKNYTMINLPDVLPSINYCIKNASASMYKCVGKNITGVTGKKLYSTKKVYNKKIGRNEWIVPMLYTTAVKIAKAQKTALGKGFCLKIYDAYRPHSTTTYVYNKFSTFLSKNKGLSSKAFSNQYGQSWFLAKSISSHNVASAIDVTLVYASNGNEAKMPTAMHELSKRAVKYTNSGTKNAKSGYASSMTSAAKTMNSIFIDAGMTTLASEWWHFQDQSGYETNKGNVGNIENWYPTKLAY